MTAKLRSDAAHNRRRILEAMRAEVVTRGPEASMEAVARSAGVAVGTLYRHFPTKADLVRAVLEQHISDVADRFEAVVARIGHGAAAGEEIRSLLIGSVESEPESRLLKETAASLDIGAAATDDMVRLDRALGEILTAGQESGDVRAGLLPGDIYLLMSTMPAHRPADDRRRWAELVTAAVLRGQHER